MLAIESARSGVAPGEATEVLRSLPKGTRNRVPLRQRFGRPSAGVIALLALLSVIAVVVVGYLTVDNAERGTGIKRGVTPPVKNEREVSIGQTAAKAYDPFGTGDLNDEHAEEAPNVVDGNPATTWSTEGYSAGTFTPKPGVGIYIDAKPGVKAASIEIQSETTGWSGAIFAAPNGAVPTKVPGNGWVKAATVSNARQTVKIPLDGTASTKYRYFWCGSRPCRPASSRSRCARSCSIGSSRTDGRHAVGRGVARPQVRHVARVCRVEGASICAAARRALSPREYR